MHSKSTCRAAAAWSWRGPFNEATGVEGLKCSFYARDKGPLNSLYTGFVPIHSTQPTNQPTNQPACLRWVSLSYPHSTHITLSRSGQGQSAEGSDGSRSLAGCCQHTAGPGMEAPGIDPLRSRGNYNKLEQIQASASWRGRLCWTESLKKST